MHQILTSPSFWYLILVIGVLFSYAWQFERSRSVPKAGCDGCFKSCWKCLHK